MSDGSSTGSVSTLLAPAVRDDECSDARALVPGSRQRVLQIVALREQGWTLDEIGARFEVSRERVRQILRAHGGPDPQDVAAARRSRAERLAEARIDELLTRWRAGMDSRRIANDLGLQAHACRSTIERFATEVDRAARAARMSRTRGALTYSDRDILVALRSAAARLGRVPSSKEYASLAGRLELPSLATVLNRMGGWSSALSSAGLRAGEGPARRQARARPRRWTEQACWEALRRAVEELEEIPSVLAYERYAAGRSDVPSAATIRNRLGRWSSLTARLAAQRELGQQARLRARSSAGALARA